jgi:hypothetical protein
MITITIDKNTSVYPRYFRFPNGSIGMISQQEDKLAVTGMWYGQTRTILHSIAQENFEHGVWTPVEVTLVFDTKKIGE